MRSFPETEKETKKKKCGKRDLSCFGKRKKRIFCDIINAIRRGH